jgi:molybdopterin-guanine dinucleotide biosynthesis protein A
MGGGPKPLLKLGERPLIAHVIDRAGPLAAPLAINANGDATGYHPFGAQILPDTLPAAVPARPGPLAGILTAMIWAKRLGADRVVTLPGDSPFLPRDLLPRLAQHAGAGKVPIIAQTDGKWQPVVGLWPTGLSGELSKALINGQRKVMEWADQARAEPLICAGKGFDNINTPKDLRHAEDRLKGKARDPEISRKSRPPGPKA